MRTVKALLSFVCELREVIEKEKGLENRVPYLKADSLD